jgi:general secretion pathway protein K
MTRQRGVALIIALLLVALGTLVVSALIEQNQLAVARTRNMLREQQAYAYARGLEAYAFEVLRRDAAEGTGIDSNNDLWATPMPPMDVPGGKLAGRMRDLNGCLNLNALVINNVPNPIEIARMQRLLRLLKLNPELTEAMIDWIDSDNTPEARGAEDLSYLLLDPPYRAANRPFRHVSELRLVKGFDDAAYRSIEPHVCAATPGAVMNVNTASDLVLRTLIEGMSEASAQRLYNHGRARYQSIDQVQGVLQQEGLVPLTDAEALRLGYTSNQFLAETMIELDGIPLNYFSVIEREAGSLRVIARSRGVF